MNTRATQVAFRQGSLASRRASRNRWIVSLSIILCGSLSATAVGQPVTLPLVQSPFEHEEYVDYSYGSVTLPYFPTDPNDPNFFPFPNVVSFDSRNRPYIRQRAATRHNSTLLCIETGCVYAFHDGEWVKKDFIGAIKTEYGYDYYEPNDPNNDFEFKAAGGWDGGEVVFDAADHMYTHVRIAPDGAADMHLLLYSPDYGDTFQVYELPGAADCEFSLEHFTGHNAFDYPPLIARTDPEAVHPCNVWGKYGDLHLLQPQKQENGGQWELTGLDPNDLVYVSDRALRMSRHAGHPSFAASAEDETYFTWIEIVDPNDPDPPPCDYPPSVTGNSVWVAVFDPNTAQVSDKTELGYDNGPINDMHNTPGIAVDSDGYLHVVTGAHALNDDPNRCASFRYSKSDQPYSVAAGFSTFTDVLGTGWAQTYGGEECAQQTYLSLVADPNDNLHIAFRQGRKNTDTYFPDPDSNDPNLPNYLLYGGLSYLQTTGGDWDPNAAATLLVVPPVSGYSNYYHKMSIDTHGRLFVVYSYYSDYDTHGLYSDLDYFCNNGCPDGDPNTNGCEDYKTYCGDPNDPNYPDNRSDYEAYYAYPAILMSDDGGSTWELAKTEELCPRPWEDLNDDHKVGLTDLSILLSNYGMTTGATRDDGDIEGDDGDVDMNDLSAMLSAYDQCKECED